MSTTVDEIRNIKKIVVFFDICSSTMILEDLLSNEKHRRWRNLLIRMKEFLVEERDELGFEIYKFLGDGWILLFDPGDMRGPSLMRLLHRICTEYDRLYQEKIDDVISCSNLEIGLTFGVDSGTLLKVRMDGKDEYVGRALNVAARLQSAIRQKGGSPAGKALISKHCYTDLRLADAQRYPGTLVKRELRNIAWGNDFEAWKIVLLKSRKKDSP